MFSSIESPWARGVALVLALAPVTYFIVTFDFSTAAWTSDTGEYVLFHPARQPLYGHFYHAFSTLGCTLPAIALIQALGLLAGMLWGETAARSASARALVFTILLSAVIPVLLGRSLFEIGTRVDGNGFVFLPRVAMVPATLAIVEPHRQEWDELNRSFIAAAKPLTCGERSMYESQLQEAIRYYIAPALLLGMSVSASLVLNALRDSRKLDAFAIGWILLSAWLVGHSLLVALSIFPETRYFLANFLVQWTLLSQAAAHVVPVTKGILSERP